MGLFANRWRTLREAVSTEAASSAVQPEQAPEPAARVKRPGKLPYLEVQQNG